MKDFFFSKKFLEIICMIAVATAMIITAFSIWTILLDGYMPIFARIAAAAGVILLMCIALSIPISALIIVRHFDKSNSQPKK